MTYDFWISLNRWILGWYGLLGVAGYLVGFGLVDGMLIGWEFIVVDLGCFILRSQQCYASFYSSKQISSCYLLDFHCFVANFYFIVVIQISLDFEFNFITLQTMF